MEGKEWRVISKEAKELVKCMLSYDPKKRFGAEECLSHEWFVKFHTEEKVDIKAAQQMLKNLKTFTAGQKLQQAALTFIVSQLTTKEDKSELQKCFSNFDKNGDGKLSKEELVEGIFDIFSKEDLPNCLEKVMLMTMKWILS